MAIFKTEIKTETNSFIEGLSKRSTVQGISLNPETKDIIVIWENPDYHSGLTVAVDYPLELVKKGKLPKNVCETAKRTKPIQAPATKQNASEAKLEPKNTIVAPVCLTAEQLTECVAKGEPVEYQGVNPVWVPFNPQSDEFVEGYYYRKVEKKQD